MSTDTPDTPATEGLFPVGRSLPLGEYLREIWRRRDYLVQDGDILLFRFNL